MRTTPAILLAASLAAPAVAQHTQFDVDVSDDLGATWHDEVAVRPGQRVDVRLRCRIVDLMPGLTVDGFAGVFHQPTLTNWFASLNDRATAFTFPGVTNAGVPTTETMYVGRHVLDCPGCTGIIFPFGGTGPGSGTSVRVATPINDPGNILRFGLLDTRPTQANVGSTMSASQLPRALAGTSYDARHDVVVFKYAVVLSRATTIARDMTASILQGTNTPGMGRWHTLANGLNPIDASTRPEDIFPASIHVSDRCPADLSGTLVPNPDGPGLPPVEVSDGAVSIEDLLYFLDSFERGIDAADLDDGSSTGTPDFAVTIDDLLFYLHHFEQGC